MVMKVAELDMAELAIRMCEANYGLTRPEGLTAKEALDAMDAEVREGWLRSANAAMVYISENIKNARLVS